MLAIFKHIYTCVFEFSYLRVTQFLVQKSEALTKKKMTCSLDSSLSLGYAPLLFFGVLFLLCIPSFFNFFSRKVMSALDTPFLL